MTLPQKIAFTKRIQIRTIKMALDEEEFREAERLGGNCGTGPDPYPGTDNLHLFSKLLAADYNIKGSVGYNSSDAPDFPMQYEPNNTCLPVAFAVQCSAAKGVKRFDILQSWIRPIAPPRLRMIVWKPAS